VYVRVWQRFGECPLCADTVAKVGNRTSLKISQKPMFSRLGRCNARQGRYEGPWSFLGKTMWSLTSPRAERISGPEKVRQPEKTFSAVSATSSHSVTAHSAN
jgi:hypothetical protein